MVDNIFRGRRYSITTYLIVAIVAVHLLLVPFLYTTITRYYKDSTYEHFVGHVTEVSGLLADVLSSKPLENNRSEIISILTTAVLGGSVQYIEVVDYQGNSIVAGEHVLIEQIEYEEDTAVNQNDDDIYFLSVPVYFENQDLKVSTLRLGFDESAVVEDYETIRDRIVLIFIVYFVSITLLIAIITRIIHKPLYLLRDRSTDIAGGALDVPLEISSRVSEIHNLADDLEAMRSSLVNLAESMQYKATHDELTDLPNRYLFNDRLEQLIAISAREGKQFAILLLDLDRFKEINDTLGHGIGDHVLVEVSKRMSQGLRDSDTVARIGGDEFSFLLAGVGQILAEKMARKIVELIEPVFEIKGHSLKIGASVGISVFPDNGDGADLLMRRADVAMYNAKHNGLQIASYHSEMDSDHYEKLMLSNDLKNSIIKGHFEGLFQPKIDLAENKICGCELLLRWHHPNLGLIYPDTFIPIAERENLIGELTRWVVSKYLHKFCELVKKDSDFHVAVNISPINLLDNELLKSINEILEKSLFPEKNLYIELTENAIMKNPMRSAEILDMFHDSGIVVSVDDFGTGYSSLAYLQKFPISELKIDKSFIKHLSEDSANYSIVSATITMAHDLGIKVVAEGVEEANVLELLKTMGCDRVQGYFYSRPVPFEEMMEWSEKHFN